MYERWEHTLWMRDHFQSIQQDVWSIWWIEKLTSIIPLFVCLCKFLSFCLCCLSLCLSTPHLCLCLGASISYCSGQIKRFGCREKRPTKSLTHTCRRIDTHVDARTTIHKITRFFAWKGHCGSMATNPSRTQHSTAKTHIHTHAHKHTHTRAAQNSCWTKHSLS